MAKGIFTQGIAVLLDREVDDSEVRELLAEFELVDNPAAVQVAYRPEINGHVLVEMEGEPWPDHMGDVEQDLETLTEWSLGRFGPFAFPGGLQRASENAHAWEAADDAVFGHQAYVSARLSYAFGRGHQEPPQPDDLDVWLELEFLTSVAQALLEHPAALGYFNPSGEVLLDAERLRESVEFHAGHGLPPLDVWCNVRIFDVDDDWAMMDCVGNGQLDLPDLEVGYPRDLCSPGEVDQFIRTASSYLLQNGNIIEDGDTMDGPGGVVWQAMHVDTGLCDPPRETQRWLPTGYGQVPAVLVDDDG